jgi:hypothetical protein
MWLAALLCILVAFLEAAFKHDLLFAPLVWLVASIAISLLMPGPLPFQRRPAA